MTHESGYIDLDFICYDQAGEPTWVERPKEGETSEIKDSYAYDGNGLRASQTVSGTTTYFTWDMTEGLPLLLSDTTNSYIYGPGGLPIEQISSGGTVTYLHHDQQGFQHQPPHWLDGRRHRQMHLRRVRNPHLRRHHDHPARL